MMRRRAFISLLGGAAATWSLGAQAQQSGQVRRIGVLMTRVADDAEGQARIAVFLKGLQELGGTDGRNVRIGLARHPGGAGLAGQSKQGSVG
jgi:putative tryptophan/tyrosine transport system substrate-binding protein